MERVPNVIENEHQNGMLRTNVTKNSDTARVFVCVHDWNTVCSNLTFTSAALMRAKVYLPKYHFFKEEICTKPLCFCAIPRIFSSALEFSEKYEQ